MKAYMHKSEVKVLILVVTRNQTTLTIQNWNTSLKAWRQILKWKAMLIWTSDTNKRNVLDINQKIEKNGSVNLKKKYQGKNGPGTLSTYTNLVAPEEVKT